MVKKALRDGFVTGIVLVSPLAITVLVLDFALQKTVGVVQPFVEATALTRYTAGSEPVATVIGAALLFGALTLFGVAVVKGVGDQAFTLFERGMSRVPVVKAIYVSVREVTNAMMRGGDRYDAVVLIDWLEDSRVMGFVTGRVPPEIQEKYDETAYFVFVPLSPNPTGGHLTVQTDSSMEHVNMTVQRGIRTVLTTGMSTEHDGDILDALRNRS